MSSESAFYTKDRLSYTCSCNRRNTPFALEFESFPPRGHRERRDRAREIFLFGCSSCCSCISFRCIFRLAVRFYLCQAGKAPQSPAFLPILQSCRSERSAKLHQCAKAFQKDTEEVCRLQRTVCQILDQRNRVRFFPNHPSDQIRMICPTTSFERRILSKNLDSGQILVAAAAYFR